MKNSHFYNYRSSRCSYKPDLKRNKKVFNGNVSICLEFKMSWYKVRREMTRWYWRFNCNSGM